MCTSASNQISASNYKLFFSINYFILYAKAYTLVLTLTALNKTYAVKCIF